MKLPPASSLQKFIFQYRGLSLAAIGLLVFLHARPTLTSCLAGFVLGLVGEALRIWAIGYSGRITRSLHPDGDYLVTGGPYSLVRNPLYVGNILNGVGVLLAACGGLTRTEAVHLTMWVFGALYLLYSSLISVEEEFLSGKFGQEYWEYHRRVPALLPNTLRLSAGSGAFSWRQGARWEISTLWWWSFTWALLLGMSLRGEA